VQSLEIAAEVRSEVVFVDTRIEDYETIVAGVAPGVEVVLIQASGDGFAQMAQALAGRTDLAAIHIVGHGQPGVLMLGSATLTAGDLEAHAAELGSIGGALGPDGDIQLWGCEIGAGAKGAAFIQALADATGADIAASDDLTGAGGDWALEVTAGDVSASGALVAANLHDFQGDLAGVAGTLNFSGPDASDLGTTVTDGEAGSGDIVGVTYEIYATQANGTPNNTVFAYYGDVGIGKDGVVGDMLEGDPVVVIRTANGAEFSFDGITTANVGVIHTRVTFEGFHNGVSTGSVTLNVDNAVTGINSYTTSDLTRSVFQNVDEVRITNPDLPDGTAEKSVFLAFDSIVFGEPVIPNAAPAIDANGGGVGTGNTASFAEDGPAVRILTSDATLTDDDNVTGMTLTLSATPNGASEIITYSAALNGGASLASLGLTGSYNSETGAYTISGAATAAAYQGVARAMVYSNASNAPVTTSRTVTIAATDAEGATGQTTSTISVTAVNDPATASNLTQSKTALQGGSVVALDDIVVSDLDTGDTVTATLTMSDPGAGVLSTGTFGSATSTFNAGTGVWTVSGSVSDVNAALAATALTPSAGNTQDFTITTRIRDAAGTGPADGTITVDVTAADFPPSVSGNIAVPVNGSYGEGDTLTFTVTFDENVTVTGSDSVLGLTIGSTAREATYASSNGASITFSYTVQPGETDANGIAVGAINLNTSTIKDGAGNDANLTLSGHLPSTTGVLVDTTAPAVANVSVPANATYAAGQNLDFTVTFDESVTVTGSDSSLDLTIGADPRSATFLSSSGNTVTYRYAVQAGETDADGITVGSLSLGGDSIRDAAGNSAVLTLNGVGSTSGVLVDANVPGVSGTIAVPADGTYVEGETLNFTVTFDETITVTGTDSTLGLTIGGTSRDATFASKTANSITYSYTVQAGDNDGDGIALNGISLNGGTILDGAGNNASLALAGHTPDTTGVLVDTAAPSFVSASVNGATLVMTYSDASLLDAVHAPAAGDFTVMVGVAPVSVTAVAINGAAHTVTLTLASPVAAGAAVTVAYGDPSGGDDANAIQDVGGADAASLTAASVTNTTAAPPVTPPPTTTPPVATIVDGVSVERVSGTSPNGSAIHTVTIPVVSSTRVDQVGNNQLADIPLVSDSSGASLLTLQVPVGFGLTASGQSAPRPASASLIDLIREIREHTSGSQDQGQLSGAATSFVNALPEGAPLLVQTIQLQAGGGSTGTPLVIQGQPQDSVQTGLVIDARSQSGVAIELQNVEFAAIIGAATVTGGAGSQHVWGDGASQSIFLGADDDVLNSGGGNDTVGSAGGNDQVRGDDGDDVVFGGEGADFVHGNAGNDTARGDAGDDRVYGGQGDDQVFGGSDNDLLFGDLGHDTLQGNTGQDTLSGGEGADLLRGGQDSDVLFGGADNDLMFGDLGRDSLQGNTGQDTLDGGAGDDILYGGQGDDVLFGGEGADFLFGDLGDDTLTGGAGADLFVTASGRGADRVLDFNFAEGDRIGLLPGTTYSAAQVGGDTVITLTGEGHMTLVNVQLSGLGDGWITTG
jgi:uncharacterized repeat protein (TIGR02059 family)